MAQKRREKQVPAPRVQTSFDLAKYTEPQKREDQVIRIKPSELEDLANIIALWQEGDILNQEGSSKRRLDAFIDKLPPIIRLTEDQFFKAIKVVPRTVSGGTTVELIISIPEKKLTNSEDEVTVSSLIEEGVLTRFSATEIVIEVINFVDQNNALVGSDKVYESVLNNLVITKKISQEQAEYLSRQIREVIKNYKNIIRNVCIVPQNNRGEIIDLDSDRGDMEVETGLVEGVQTDIVETLLNPASAVETREERHARLRRETELANQLVRAEQGDNSASQEATQNSETVAETGTTRRTSRQRRRDEVNPSAEREGAIVEATSTEKAKAYALFALFGTTILAQGTLSYFVGEYWIDAFQSENEMLVFLLVYLAQLIPSLAVSVIGQLRYEKNNPSKNNEEFITRFGVRHLKNAVYASAAVNLPVLAISGTANLVEYLRGQAVEAIGASGLTREEQNKLLGEEFVSLLIKIGFIGFLLYMMRYGWRDKQKRIAAEEEQKKKKEEPKPAPAPEKKKRKLLPRREKKE